MAAEEWRMASIREIAENCHVSPAAVSRILNRDERLSVSAAVRQSVEEEARRLGYETPRQKRNNQIKNISVALAPFDKPGFEERVISRLQPFAGPKCRIQLFNRNNEKVDGIIAIGEFTRDEVRDFESVSSNLLMINNLGTSYAHDSIMVDYAQNEESVIRMFLRRDISSLAYLGGTFQRCGSTIGVNRACQFKALMQKYGLYEERFFLLSSMDEESGYKTVMNMAVIPQGIIFSDPDFARGALKALKERGADPLTVTYVNFFVQDVTSGCALLIFPDDILRTALKLLMEKIRGERVQSYSIYAPSVLMEKSSPEGEWRLI